MLVLNKAEKQKIKKQLQFGDITKIARMINKSRFTVNRWFNDESNSSEITEAVSILLKKKQNALESIRKTLM